MTERSNRHRVMDDPHFWTALAYGACGWLHDSEDTSLRRFWIDDFLPENAANTKFGVDVDGIAWVGEGPRDQHPYRFVVYIPQKMLGRWEQGFTIEQLVLDKVEKTLQLQIVSERRVA